MGQSTHHVIIGSGSAGHAAAVTIRGRDPNARITLVTLSSLPFYNRYDLPSMFRGKTDWRDLLAVPPKTYDDLGITLRRNTRVVNVDGQARTITFAHNEQIAFDKLLVCSGGAGYVPEVLSQYRPLISGFGSFESATVTCKALPPGATAIMIGGDMMGIDLALTLLDTGRKVVLAVNDYTFWPHKLSAAERAKALDSLKARGMEVVTGHVGAIEELQGKKTRAIRLDDGSSVQGNAVLVFCGLSPLVEFMLGAGVDIERGLLVNTELKTSHDAIWAAGDVCQIWSDAEKDYKFFHGWKNVRLMGELAARNMTGAHESFEAGADTGLQFDDKGALQSSFWKH